MLIHWPGVARQEPTSPANAAKRLESWQVLERLYDAGQCRAIGVSNFHESQLQELLQHARIPPMVNQVRDLPVVVHKSENGMQKSCQLQPAL
jgi:diketogulonate reductase-like aldo/keto reductase